MFNPSRTRIAAAALATVAALALASCSSSDSGGSGGSNQVTLTMAAGFGTPNAQKSIETLIKEFEDANPNVKIKPTFTPYASYDNVLGTEVSSGNLPDIIFSLGTGTTFPSFTGSLAKSGVLLDASDQGWAKEVPDAIKPLVGADGKIYSWPTYVTYTGVLYNMTALQKAGAVPPEKWSDVLPYCRKMRAAGITPYAIPLADPVAVPGQALDSISSTTVYNDDPTWDQDRAAGKTTFASTAGWTEAFDKFAEMGKAGCFPDNATAASQQENMTQTSAGQAGGWMANHSAQPYLQTKDNKIEFHLFPARDSDNWAQASAFDAWSVTKKTKHPKEALAWLKFVADPTKNRWHAQQSGGIPMVDYEDPNTFASVDKALVPLVEAGHVHWYGLWPAGVATTVEGPGMQSLYLGDITVPKLLQQMDQAWDGSAK